ncbi:MAG: secretion system protein E, partial [Burkholderiales bacterium 12-64-5]
ATELLFNHAQQFSGLLGDSMKVQSALDTSKDGVSRSLAFSLAEHVKAKRITKGDALRSVAGQGVVYRRVQELLDGV